VEEIRIGDHVTTAAGLSEPVRWIGRRSYSGKFIAGNRSILPVCIHAGALGDNVPARDLFVSPHHAMFIDDVLVPAVELVNGVSITQADEVERVEYVHIELARHEVILAEGAPTESFVDDDSRMMFHNAHEYAALYPDARREPALYCAPRVTEGFALEAVRHRLAMRAGLHPGHEAEPLRGCIDVIRARLVAGWAQNPLRPEIPVCVDICLDGAIIAQGLANRHRPDLATAGLGSGHHSFSVELPESLTRAQQARLEVRRSSDHALVTRAPHLVRVKARRDR
jgi:hypothetical protein